MKKKLLFLVVLLFISVFAHQMLEAFPHIHHSHHHHLRKHLHQTITHVTHTVHHGLTAAQKKAKKAKDKIEKANKDLTAKVEEIKNLPEKTKNIIFSMNNALDSSGKETLVKTIKKYWNELKKFIHLPEKFGEHLLLCMMAYYENPFYLKEMTEGKQCVPTVRQSPKSDLKYSEVCFLCTHNSYSTYTDFYFPYGQQIFSTKEQLGLGVRAFMFDTYKNKGKIVLSHGKLKYQKFLRAILYATGKGKFMHYSKVLKELKHFIALNRGEIITIILEDYVKDYSKFKKLYHDIGLSSYIYTKNDFDKNKGWPTIGEMIKKNKRVVIFVGDSKSAGKYHFKQWDYMVENQYGTLKKEKASKERSSSKSAGKKYHKRDLLLLNFFDDNPLTEWSKAYKEIKNIDFKDLKNYPSHLLKVLKLVGEGISVIDPEAHKKYNTVDLKLFLKYERSHGLNGKYKKRYPNFIAPDFISIGNPLSIVNFINRKAALDHKKMFFRLKYK
ncbi:hypothetical protein KAJ27_04340 [bacterium]|nr:hypothetical protein [bacterium]